MTSSTSVKINGIFNKIQILCTYEGIGNVVLLILVGIIINVYRI